MYWIFNPGCWSGSEMSESGRVQPRCSCGSKQGWNSSRVGSKAEIRVGFLKSGSETDRKIESRRARLCTSVSVDLDDVDEGLRRRGYSSVGILSWSWASLRRQTSDDALFWRHGASIGGHQRTALGCCRDQRRRVGSMSGGAAASTVGDFIRSERMGGCPDQISGCPNFSLIHASADKVAAGRRWVHSLPTKNCCRR